MYPEMNITKQNLQNMTVDESMRVYEELLQENLQLKNQIERAKTTKYYSTPNIHSPTTAYRTTYVQSPLHHAPPQPYSPLTLPSSDLTYYQRNLEYDIRQENEHYLEQLLEKNRYLEEKIERLRNIHSKQHHDIEQIRRSRQWESRFDCKEDNCYEEKYMQLLRVRSPFY